MRAPRYRFALTLTILVTFTLPLFAQHGNPSAPADPHTAKFKFAPIQRPQLQLPPQAGKRRGDRRTGNGGKR